MEKARVVISWCCYRIVLITLIKWQGDRFKIRFQAHTVYYAFRD